MIWKTGPSFAQLTSADKNTRTCVPGFRHAIREQSNIACISEKEEEVTKDQAKDRWRCVEIGFSRSEEISE